MADLKRPSPNTTRMIVEQFRAALAYRQQLAERERAERERSLAADEARGRPTQRRRGSASRRSHDAPHADVTPRRRPIASTVDSRRYDNRPPDRMRPPHVDSPQPTRRDGAAAVDRAATRSRLQQADDFTAAVAAARRLAGRARRGDRRAGAATSATARDRRRAARPHAAARAAAARRPRGRSLPPHPRRLARPAGLLVEAAVRDGGLPRTAPATARRQAAGRRGAGRTSTSAGRAPSWRRCRSATWRSSPRRRLRRLRAAERR